MAKNDKWIKFGGVRIRMIDIRRQGENAPFVKINMQAALSAHVQSKMGWSIGEGNKSGKFLGNIAATNLIIGPVQTKLAGMEVAEVQINCHEVTDFAFTERMDKNGTRLGVDLDFCIKSNDPEAALKFDQYWRAMLGSESALKVVYSAIGKQTHSGEENTEDDADTPK